MSRLRIVLVGKDLEMRLVSLIVRAKEVSDEVILFDLGSSDETIELAKEVGCQVFEIQEKTLANNLCRKLTELKSFENNLMIKINSEFRLRDFPMLVNRSSENWDVHMALFTDHTGVEEPINMPLNQANALHICLSQKGLLAMAELSDSSTPQDLPGNLSVRVLFSRSRPNVTQRESLASASKIAQFFYWMFESKHPLITFGIPGFILFFVGYKLSGDVLDTFSEFNQTSLGVSLAVIAVTLIGLFSMMVGVTLYIMGKQIKQVKAQYEDWPD